MKLKVFISWSGEMGKEVAARLASWLPIAMREIEPLYSPDMDKGIRWGPELSRWLKESDVGILCVTNDNYRAPRLLFEAGALSKAEDVARVIPFLVGVSKDRLKDSPLLQFQTVEYNERDERTTERNIKNMLESLRRICQSASEPGKDDLSKELLSRQFDQLGLFDNLKKRLDPIIKKYARPKPPAPKPPAPSVRPRPVLPASSGSKEELTQISTDLNGMKQQFQKSHAALEDELWDIRKKLDVLQEQIRALNNGGESRPAPDSASKGSSAPPVSKPNAAPLRSLTPTQRRQADELESLLLSVSDEFPPQISELVFKPVLQNGQRVIMRVRGDHPLKEKSRSVLSFQEWFVGVQRDFQRVSGLDAALKQNALNAFGEIDRKLCALSQVLSSDV